MLNTTGKQVSLKVITNTCRSYSLFQHSDQQVAILDKVGVILYFQGKEIRIQYMHKNEIITYTCDFLE